MIHYGIIISGFGGQGVLTFGKMLALAGMEDGFQVTYYPSYGAEVRGGTAHCGVIISDSTIASPIVYKADVLIAMNDPSLRKFLPRLKDHGKLLCNSSLIAPDFFRHNGRELFSIPATELSREMKMEKATNMMMAGYFFKHFPLLNEESFLNSLDDVFPNITQELKTKNREIFRRGFEYDPA
ncbi:MAG: 2-oxoacid:ferredoxin oxidoreductase subunit gamma [Candidatus Auribacter fodinae]|jgi:2-oxoglutarate ferredoxin oxidoreductase subunit gamma|uniref:2-oxoacid:ferredoxin oxidoreductase subunit gamma n=1 Tax=Candidatus Auribacter fodinae TaxID=2093366 RepID=A0A3A4R785_9BACT|nr:MAG: 2-oxoacid:ferredoxin oxidoreductase subunit gamma [Candidatus Auribacter fodinae]